MKKVLFAVLAATIALCSCTTPYHKLYVGTDRPRDEVALLVYTGRGLFAPIKDEHRAVLKQVDDVSRRFGSQWDGSYRIELLPGIHTLVICCVRNLRDAPIRKYQEGGKTYLVYPKPLDITRSFTAQAGHVYTPKAKFNYPPGEWQLWIEDVTSR